MGPTAAIPVNRLVGYFELTLGDEVARSLILSRQNQIPLYGTTDRPRNCDGPDAGDRRQKVLIKFWENPHHYARDTSRPQIGERLAGNKFCLCDRRRTCDRRQIRTCAPLACSAAGPSFSAIILP